MKELNIVDIIEKNPITTISNNCNTNNIITKWETIAKAAVAENMSAAKMSRSVKDGIKFGDFYYCAALQTQFV